MSGFEQAFVKTVGVEGDFSDDPNDAGGKTRFGITEAEARAHGYTGDMRALPFETAKAIMKAGYWDLLHGDAIAARSQPIAEELFDTGVNMGPGAAGRFLQRALNVLSPGADLAVDGLIGPLTLFRLGQFLELRGKNGEAVMLLMLNSQQGVRYIEIAESKPSQESFVYGWFNQRVRV